MEVHFPESRRRPVRTAHIMRLMHWRRNLPLGLMLGAGSFSLALAIWLSAGNAMAGLPFPMFLVAVLVTAVFGGWRPAALVAMASFAAALQVFLPPAHAYALGWPQGAIALGLFGVCAMAQIILVDMLHHALDELVSGRGRIEALLAHQRILYQEVQHRVANNLQSLASTLTLQAARLEDVDDAAMALEAAVRRLHSVASVHRRLHDPDLTGDDLGEVFTGLLQDLIHAAGREDVRLIVEVAPLPIEPQTATLLAMIITEAAANSLKHGFGQGQGGCLRVALRQDADGTRIMTVEDDGQGRIQAPPRAGPVRLGTMIMQGLAQRLGGTLQLDVRPGAGTRLTLAIPPPMRPDAVFRPARPAQNRIEAGGRPCPAP